MPGDLRLPANYIKRGRSRTRSATYPMQPLDETTTRMLIRAIDMIQDEEGIDLLARDHPLLRLQRLDPIETENGAGYCLAIGQLSQIDPPRYQIKMILIVVDQRDRQSWEGRVLVFPVAGRGED